MIYGFFGDVGSGKTLSMTMYAYLYQKLGYSIYSNYKLTFPHILIDYEFIEDIVKEDKQFTGKNLFLLDEVGIWMDSRLSGTKQNRMLGYFTKQVRKKDIKLMYSEQMEHAVDKRLKGLTKTKILCTTKEILLYPKDKQEPYVVTIAYNTIIIHGKKARTKRYVANPFFKFYDTKELIKVTKRDLE